MIIPCLIGYELKKAKKLLDVDIVVLLEETITPYNDKQLERQDSKPIIVRQKILDGTLILTTSLFK